MTYGWHESYEIALLGTDWTKMSDRVLVAESEIRARQRELSEDHGGTPEESQAIADAMNCLHLLGRDAASWRDREGVERADL